MNKQERNAYMRDWYAKNKTAERTKRLSRPSEQKEVRAAQRRTDKAQSATKAYNMRYAETINGRALRLVLSAKKRALRSGLAFAIDVSDVAPLLVAGTCQRTGIAFDLSATGDRNKRHPFAPSIDQVNPKGGYTRDNIEIVCWIYNVCKSDFNAETVLKFANALATRPL